MKVALTGATGFVGGHLLEKLLKAGHFVNALTRRLQPARAGVEWIKGNLADSAALAGLVDGADATIHVAGVLNARNAAEFETGNVAGTAAVLVAATSARVERFVHVSSLAAREPALSLYGGSKAKSEAVVATSAINWAIVRPPAVYGPGDRETLDLFRMAAKGFVLLPPAGRLSLIHVDDLAELLVALADPAAPSELRFEPDDGSGGITHVDFARTLGQALNRSVRAVSLPESVLSLGAKLDRLARGGKAKLTADRVAYFCHPDWVVDPGLAVPARLWQPKITAREGFAATADWYRAHRWL